MKTLTVDTDKVITILEKKGYTKEQAEGLVEAARQVDLSELATKSEHKVLETKLNFVLGLEVAIFVSVLALLLDKIV
jgi:hypothetical protein